MLTLDNRTLLIVITLISIGSAIALIALWKAQTERNGAGFWATGMSLIALASLLISGRSIISDFISVVIANTLYAVGFILLLRGLRVFTGQRELNWLDVGLPFICMAGYYYYYYLAPNLNARIVIFSGAFVIISCAVVITMVSNKHAPWRSAGMAVAAVFAAFGLSHGARGIAAIFSHFQHNFMHPSVTSSLVFLVGIFLLGGIVITLILLTYSALEAKHRITSLAVEQSASSIIITNTQGQIEYVNPAFTEKTGYPSFEVIGQNPRILRGDETPPEHYDALWTALNDGQTWRGEFHNKKKNGELFWEIASIAPVKQRNGLISHYVAIKEDITALKDAKERILHLANHDSLTGLPARRLAVDRFDRAIALAKRNQIKAAVMFVDLDGFKQVNDTFGHEAGDEILIQVATRLRSAIREVDTVARIGGDEFWVLMSDLHDRSSAANIANKIINTLCEPFHYRDCEASISASIGIALYPDHGETQQALIQFADQAMYQIKRQGKNNYAFADAFMANASPQSA